MLDRTPPAFFKQGTTAFTKLLVFAALSVLLMMADLRWTLGQPIRNAMATTLYPVQWVLRQPVMGAQWLGDYLQSLDKAIARNEQLTEQLLDQAATVQQVDYLKLETQRLQNLLDLHNSFADVGTAARVVAQTPDPYSKRVILDKGTTQGIRAGSAVIDINGVYGQVTRAFLLTSEVTVLTDRNQSTPVMNARTGERSVLFGEVGGDGTHLELRFVSSNADIQTGDLLMTSGIDGVYPPGLPVATIVDIPLLMDTNYASIRCKPLSNVDATRHVLVMPSPELVAPVADAMQSTPETSP
ncbi:MAG: rod shape-determining protein MreC [Burkholderiaceae bacterium]|nr:rod shape-determining protein MreC [Burkholderiaceae bacterium]